MKKCLIILMLLLPVAIGAQEAKNKSQQVTGRVSFVNINGKPAPGPGALFYEVLNKAVAHEAGNAFKKLFAFGAESPDMFDKVDALLKEYEIKSETRLESGYFFKCNASPSMAFIFVDKFDGAVLVVDVEPGRTEYNDNVIHLKTTEEVVSGGTYKPKIIAECSNDDPGDGNSYFTIKLVLPKGYARSDSRMLFQLYAVDCETEDTLDYPMKFAAEGDKFHKLQVKRMGFNYEKNDPVAKFYRKDIVLNDSLEFSFKTMVVWPKPDSLKDRTFRGSYAYTLEDLNHQYYEGSDEPSCLQGRPFKLLDITPALCDLPLSQEFYEEPGKNSEDKEDKLNLLFEKGTDRLTSSEVNVRERDRLIELVGKYGRRLLSLTIVGAASPDGSVKFNTELAKKRAQAARNMMVKSGKLAIQPDYDVRVYTWRDVVNELRMAGKTAQADQLSEMIRAGEDNLALSKRIAALPYYASDIEPVLETQRAMLCQYSHTIEQVMSPTQCVEQYFKRKGDYLKHTAHFSNGDFYSLFDTVTDSLELDSITVMAYQEITKEPGYATENKMAPYVCNRMARRMMLRGTPDVNILRPFIDLHRRSEKNRDQGIDVLHYTSSRSIPFNRRQIVANQAVCYFMEQKVDTALYLLQWLKDCGKADSRILLMESMMDLQKLHFKQNRTKEEEVAYRSAIEKTLAMSDDNKAVLYTEIKEWGHRKEALHWISKMKDTNPSKWYLRAIIAADNIDSEIPLTDVPQYLAYFQHCFDLDDTKRFVRYYLQERHIGKDLRKRYKWKKANADKYRQLFNMIQGSVGAVPQNTEIEENKN